MRPESNFNVKLVLAVRAVQDFDELYPEWAELQVTPELLTRIHELQSICLRDKLFAVVDGNWGPDRWGSQSVHRVRSEKLVVTKRHVWFAGRPQYAEFDVETNAVMISHLVQLATRRSPKLPQVFVRGKGEFFVAPNKSQMRYLVNQYEDQCAAA